MPKRVVRKAASAAKKAVKSAKVATKKATTRSAKATSKKRVGDVLGVSSTRVPKAAKKPKSSGRKRKTTDVARRATGIGHLKPARVRG